MRNLGDFIRGGLARRKVDIGDVALAKVFHVCRDVPYNVQRLCAGLYESDALPDGATVTAAVVEAELLSLLADAHANYLALYLTMTPTQRRVLAGMAALPDLNATVASSSRSIGVAASTYRTARKSFVSADLLHERFGHSQTRREYAFVDPFFREWIRGFVRG